MATKFTLQPKPTFKANVSIPRAGDEDGVLTFTFNHKPLKELADLEKLEGKTATDFLMEIISGWALPDTFNAENLSLLLENYPAAMRAIPETYYRELMGQREKLIAVASAFYTPEPTAADWRHTGLRRMITTINTSTSGQMYGLHSGVSGCQHAVAHGYGRGIRA